jgi:hypothetical protein
MGDPVTARSLTVAYSILGAILLPESGEKG